MDGNQEGSIEEGTGEEGTRQEGTSEEGTRQEGTRQKGSSPRSADRKRGWTRRRMTPAPGEIVVDASSDIEGASFDWVKEGWGNFEYFSGKVSDVARQLSLVGVAVVVFVTGLTTTDFATGDAVELPDRLIVAAAFLAISLGLDLLHYMTGSALWFAWPRWHEHQRDKHPETYVRPVRYPDSLARVLNVLLILKLVSAATGWSVLVVHLAYSVK